MSLRRVADPFVVAPPAGARVRARIPVGSEDAEVLEAVGRHLGSLAGADLARRCSEGRLDARGRTQSRRVRKRGLTAESSSRWAGAITATSEDGFGLALGNLQAEQRSLRARAGRIRRRLAVPVGGRRGRLRGYASPSERFEKQRRLQILEHRLREVEARLGEGRVSVCRGGRRLAQLRHHLEPAGLDEEAWRERWEANRLFITADGESDKAWGNETIRWHPDQRWVEVRLPGPLGHLGNRRHGRYRLSCPITFAYRGEEVAAQSASGAVRYDVSFDPAKGRWYLDASWRFDAAEPASLDELRRHRALAVDLNAGHLAAAVVDPAGNPVGGPATVALDLAGLRATTRDGQLRSAISELIRLARRQGCRSIAIEDLDFAAQRAEGREHTGRRPSRGVRGRTFRRLVAGIPTARFRDRLVLMATNAGLAVIAIDPAYTSRWGAQHWLAPLKKISPEATGHHAAAVVIGRRGFGQRARRRERCASTPPVDGRERATNSAVRATSASAGLSEQRHTEPGARKARGQPPPWQKTRPAQQAPPGDQGGEDRSRHPETAMSYSLPR